MKYFFCLNTDSIEYSTVLSNTNMDSDREITRNQIRIHPFNIHIKINYEYEYPYEHFK
jgi:hypothetical protein